MPRRDGTGPAGMGPMTGRGFGICAGGKDVAYESGFYWGRGRGCRRGFGRGFGRYFLNDAVPSKTDKEFIEQQKALLEKRLEEINKQLENM